MKTLAIFLLPVLTSTTWAANTDCLQAAQEIAKAKIEARLEGPPDMSLTSDFTNPVETLDPLTGNKIYTSSVSYATRFWDQEYLLSYKADVRVVLSSACAEVKVTGVEHIMNIKPTETQGEGSCANESGLVATEFGLLCGEGLVDSCGVYPEAETHACVPKLTSPEEF